MALNMRITKEDYIKAMKKAAREDKNTWVRGVAHKSKKDYDRKKQKITIYNYEYRQE
jgi:uncharacterized protein YhjY with autotransporter beta-barrel domain